ncbi:hypothetical protein OHS71_18525 [Streptomyces sp. NBC_00377]|uniref:hypothetical protein n=1 Tax=unclassified Streptomyces TaxID=2593676 RepID=UPI002E21A72E|nr:MULTISPECIES: hypothetical protein [unclassified Streptomyces]
MPRGRHRHSPPLHRLLPPSAIAGVSLVCALGPWVFTERTTLRVLAAAAAATAIIGAVVMRRWDSQAGKQVADLARSRASDEWRYEERVAELESDLDESRELRVKLEQRLRSKRAELAGLRNEHAALLRRYATAETERASALEGRRLLEIEAAPAPELPAARTAQDAEATVAVAEVDPQDAVDAQDADAADARDAEGVEGTDAVEAEGDVEGEGQEGGARASGDSAEAAEPVDESAEADEEGAKASTVFSPEGSKLFLRAQEALDRLDSDAVEVTRTEGHAEEESARAASADVGAPVVGGESEAAQEDEAQGKPEAVDEHTRATAPHKAAQADALPEGRIQRDETPAATETDDVDARAEADAHTDGDAHTSEDAHTVEDVNDASAMSDHGGDVETVRPTPAPDFTAPVAAPGLADDSALAHHSAPVHHSAPADGFVPAGTSVTAPASILAPAPVSTLDPDASGAGALVPRPAAVVQRRSAGHFAVPTAVAVVPAAQPVRRPTAEGGFDFFGTKGESMPHALEAVQNEDLADVVGQEALALHKAESEAEFKPVDEAARGVGQVIDLTAHDETEQIDLQGLRSAVS